MTTEYLTVADTSKLIRLALKKRYPDVKFSVRSKSYSGGASVDISWTDGPLDKEVNHFVKGFEGASFDGMNDLKSNQVSWLKEDGTAELAYRPDSCGGSIPAFYSDAPTAQPKLVNFGADFVFTNRSVTDCDQKDNINADYIRQHCSCEGTAPNDRFGYDWVTSLARRMTNNALPNETTADVFQRVIIDRKY